MRKLRSSKRGQFMIIGALLICMVIISGGIIAHSNLNVGRQYRAQSYDQVIIGVDQDLKRSLANSLAMFTDGYLQGHDYSANASGYQTEWQKAIMAMFPGRGVNISISCAQYVVQPQKALSYLRDGTTRSYSVGPVIIAAGKTVTSSWNSSWASWKPRGLSAAYSNLTLSVDSDGLTGWQDSCLVLLNVTLTSLSTTTGIVTLNVTVLEENMIPVKGLRMNSFSLSIRNGTQLYPVQNSTVTLYYLGYGVYQFSFPQDITNKDTRVVVKDSRGIIAVIYSGV